MRYEFIHKEKETFPISVMCDVLGVSRSGYYEYVASINLKATVPGQKTILLKRVGEIHKNTGQIYGSRRMSEQLKSEGYDVGRFQARTLMNKAGIAVRSKKKFQVTTNSRHNDPVAPNLLNQNFETDRPNEVWVGDITYLWTAEGWVYLAVVLDLFSRRIVGWSIDSTMTSDLVESALDMAVRSRRPSDGLIFHSDRGSQYTSGSYQKLLNKHKMVPSMSSTGNCYDNAVCERFHRSLKHERTEYESYRTLLQIKENVHDYIQFYNYQRLHSTLGYQSPVMFELKAARAVA